MSRTLTKEKVTQNKDEAIQALTNMLDCQIESDDESDYKRADLISFWIKNYVELQDKEASFDPLTLLHYYRGNIVKVNFGYRIGNEEGGLHYAVVIDSRNSKHSGILTVVPLSSKKEGKPINKYSVDMGNILYDSVVKRQDECIKNAQAEQKICHELLYDSPDSDLEEINDKLYHIEKKIKSFDRQKKEIGKMKQGSVALVSQVTTISKMRICDPIATTNSLFGIQVTKKLMKEIDSVFREFYLTPRTKPSKKTL